MIRFIASINLIIALASPVAADPAAVFAEHCASCHGADRLGGTGPALIPESLRRLRGERLAGVIREGRPATQMPAFADTLSEDEIAGLAAFLHEPVAEVPEWGAEQIAARAI